MAHDIFGFQVQMDYVLSVHVCHSFAYLAHEEDAVLFGQGEVVCYHSLEQLSTRNAAGYPKNY